MRITCERAAHRGSRVAGGGSESACGVGRRSRLPDGVYLASVTTPEGVVERERVAVAFERDGSADPTEITLLGDGGTARVLQVRPLADAVRILDAS